MDELVKKLTNAPMLQLPQDGGQYQVESDASDYAVGGVLSLKTEKGWKPMSYYSKTLNDAETRYSTYDKELLAILRCLQEWCGILLGGKFEICTDHRNLTYFRDPKKLTRQQANWMVQLQDFEYDITYIKGGTNRVADALS